MMSQGVGWRQPVCRIRKHSRPAQEAELSAEQETAWKAYTERCRLSQSAGRPEPGDMRLLSTPERLEKMQAMMKEHENTWKAALPYQGVLRRADA
jgi:hypothetical protein